MDKTMTYEVVSGSKSTFESQINRLSDEGYITTGSLDTCLNQDGSVHYSILMGKMN